MANSITGLPALTSTADVGSVPGGYAIAVSLGSLASSKYDFSFVNGMLTVSKGALTVTADPASKVYGTANPGFSATYAGFVGSDNFANSVTGSPNLTSVADTGSVPGSYAITASVGSLASAKYNLSFANGILTVNKAMLTVTANPASKAYGTANPVFTASYSGFFSTDDFATSVTGSPALSSTADSTSAPGGYTITASVGSLASTKYSFSFVNGVLTVGKAVLTITASPASKVYGASDPELLYSVSGSANGDSKAVLSGGLSRISGESVGNYAITLGNLSAGANYTIVFVSANLAITKKVITVTAVPQTKSYGDPDPTLTYSIDQPLLSGDSFSGALSRLPGGGVVGSPYQIQQGTLALNGNYTINFITANLTVRKRAASVASTAAGKIYGAPDPLLTGTLNGFLAADNVTASYGRTTGESVAGTPYQITAILSPAGVLGNYDITYSSAMFTIAKKAASVTASSVDRVYGDPDPALITVNSGFLPADLGVGKITFGATRALGENVQAYVITPTSSDNGTGMLANYTVQCNDGIFTISKAPLTITAENIWRSYGVPNPVLIARYDGLASFDSAASLGGVPSLTTTADASSDSGSYAIVVSLGSITCANYRYSLVNGLLTVTGDSAQSIDFPPMRPKTFGDGDFDPGASASSGLPVGYASSAPGIAKVVGGKLRVVAPGSADIAASQPGSANYLPATDVVRNLVVNPPPWNGLGFDGLDDLVQIADAPQLNFGSKPGFCIETWLHLDGSQPDGTGLLAKGLPASPGSGYQLLLYQDRIAAEITGVAGSFGVPDGLIGTSRLNDGQWHHVALAVDRSLGTAALYLDGRLEVQLADPALATNPDNSEALRVGVDRSGSRFFRGELDELRIWDTVRSREQIRSALAQILDPLDEPQLAAYFHFDEGDAGLDNASFATAPERTANAADGALQGFALSGGASNWVVSGAFLPLLETAPLSAVTSASAIGGGTVYPNYYPASEVGLCWGESPDPGLQDSCSRSVGLVGSFAGQITGLVAGVSYHVRGFARNQMGTAYGNDISFQAAKLQQTISLTLSDKTYGDADFNPGGVASSGLAVTYSSSNPAVAIVVNGKIEVTGAGNTIITVSQAGNQSFSPAPEVSLPLTVNKKSLTVTADNQGRAYQTPNPPLTASYQGFVKGEGLSVVSGAPLLSTGALTSSPIGNYDIVITLGTLAAKNYSFVLINGTLGVFRSCQEIIFPAIGDRTYGDPPVALIASSCSGLGIGFSSSNAQIAQVTGDLLAINGAGSVVITASQGGSDNLDRAPDVSQTLIVHKGGQSVNMPSLAPKTLGDPPFGLQATATSGLPVSYLSSDPGVAVVSGASVTIVGAGTTVITATQGGNGNYNAALPASVPLTVSMEATPPQLALSTLSSGAVTADPVLNIMGVASDDSGIASLTVDGADLTGQAALFSSSVPLVAGENSISVIARDTMGNKTTQTIDITLDAAAPLITLSTPADNSVTDSSFFTATGTVTAGSSLKMTVNGGSQQSLVVAQGAFNGGGYLQSGTNTIELTATLSGRSSSAKRSVTLVTGKPCVAITEPVEDLRSETQSWLVRGTAGAQGGGVNVVIEVEGSRFLPSVQSGAFQQQIALSATGPTRITASATDGFGNVSVAQRNILRLDRIPGDLNGDGLVDVRDALALLRISLGLDPITKQALANGDLAPLVNGVPQPDGKIDVGDVLVLLRKVVGLVDF